MSKIGAQMNAVAIMAMIEEIGMGFGGVHPTYKAIEIEGTVTISEHGKSGSRRDDVRNHHKDIKRKKRARKNKRGY